MASDLILHHNPKSEEQNSIDWSKHLGIGEIVITPQKLQRCYIQSVKTGGKFKIQFGFGSNDNFKLLFGISTYQNRKQERSDLNIEIPPSCQQTMQDLDELILETAKDRKGEWWPQEPELSDEQIEDRYIPATKVDPSGNFMPNTKCKISLYGNENKGNTQVFEYCSDGCTRADGSVYSGKNDLLVVEDEIMIRTLLEPKCRCLFVVQISNIWFMNNAFGPTLDCKMVACFPKKNEMSFFMPELMNADVKVSKNDDILNDEDKLALKSF